MIDHMIKALVNYAVSASLIDEADRVYCTNAVLSLIKKDDYDFSAKPANAPLNVILDAVCEEAIKKGIIDGGIVSRDLFDTAIMGAFTPRPSALIKKFFELYSEKPEKATDFYYKFSKDTNYIRRDRIAKLLKWQYSSEYGVIDVTVNLSKPEKDPKAIAAAKNMPQTGYPKCMLCRECEGYEGRTDFPARQNHRLIPVKLDNSDWFMQYSPYVYYNEHCIVLNSLHRPMKIDRSTFSKLLEFVTLFPHYFLGSNADLPIVGGSILSHEHFQGGRYEFAMERAEIETKIKFKGYQDISAGIIKWPMSTVRLLSEDKEKLIELADKILKAWRKYSDPDSFIFAETAGKPHNTITAIARRRGENYELDLILRNNITTKERPLGVFHPHSELHHIKKENIGLIEAMGLAVLPPRLKAEFEALKNAILTGKDLRTDPLTAKHAAWTESFVNNYNINEENCMNILKRETGKAFAKVLEHSGVFKRNKTGLDAFMRFIESV